MNCEAEVSSIPCHRPSKIERRTAAVFALEIVDERYAALLRVCRRDSNEPRRAQKLAETL